MDFFSLKNNDPFTLYIKDEEVSFWLHFFSAQSHWRGLEITTNQLLDQIDIHQLQLEFQLFDGLYQKMLMHLPERDESKKELIPLALTNDLVVVIHSELEDYKEFCIENGEDQFGKLCNRYLETMKEIYELNDKNESYH